MISATTTLTVAEMLRARHWHQRRHRWALNSFIALGLVAVALGCWRLTTYRPMPFAAIYVGIGCSLIFRTPLMNWRAGRNLEKSADLGEIGHWQFTEEELRFQSAKGEFKIYWQAFTKTVTSPEMHLLYLDKRQQRYLWLPKTAFATSADEEAFAQLLVRSTPHEVVR